jgi:hypothetical protein
MRRRAFLRKGPTAGAATLTAPAGAVTGRFAQPHRPGICDAAVPIGPCVAFTDGPSGVLPDGGAVKHPVAWDKHLVAFPRRP